MKKEAEVGVMRLLAEGHKLKDVDCRSWRRLAFSLEPPEPMQCW